MPQMTSFIFSVLMDVITFYPAMEARIPRSVFDSFPPGVPAIDFTSEMSLDYVLFFLISDFLAWISPHVLFHKHSSLLYCSQGFPKEIWSYLQLLFSLNLWSLPIADRMNFMFLSMVYKGLPDPPLNQRHLCFTSFTTCFTHADHFHIL